MMDLVEKVRARTGSLRPEEPKMYSYHYASLPMLRSQELCEDIALGVSNGAIASPQSRQTVAMLHGTLQLCRPPVYELSTES